MFYVSGHANHKLSLFFWLKMFPVPLFYKTLLIIVGMEIVVNWHSVSWYQSTNPHCEGGQAQNETSAMFEGPIHQIS